MRGAGRHRGPGAQARRRRSAAACAALLVLLLAACEPGAHDTSFSGDGIATLDYAADDTGLAALITPTGRTVIAGYSGPGAGNDWAPTVFRVREDGTPDTSFSGDGMASPNLDGRYWDVARTTDNKYVAIGHDQGVDFRILVSRFHPNGTADMSFGGGDGHAQLDLGFDDAWGMAIDIDDKGTADPTDDDYWIAGAAGTSINDHDPFVALLDAAGALNPGGFGMGNGYVTYDAPSRAIFEDVVYDAPRDRVIAVGGATDPWQGGDPASETGWLIGGWDADPSGFEDPAFDPLLVQFDNGSASSVYVRPDGRVVVAGREDRFPQNERVKLLRLGLDGDPDPTFGPSGDGIVRFPLGDGSLTAPWSMVRAPDGKILVGGTRQNTVDFRFQMVVARFTPGGLIDTSFGGTGWVETGKDREGWGAAVTDTTVTVVGRRILGSEENLLIGRWLT